MNDLIRRQMIIDLLDRYFVNPPEYMKDYSDKLLHAIKDDLVDDVNSMPSAEPDEKLEKCRFEYINACRIVTFPTPDTTKKDMSDAYAVIKALQPIFGDVTF